MAHAKSYIAFKVILKNQAGEILALEARADGLMHGYYDLPGGRTDEHEVGKDISEIITREITEELGDIEYKLDSRPITIVSWMWPENRPITFIYYLADFISGEIQISDEHLSYKWIEYSEQNIDKYFTSWHLKAMKPIIKHN